MPELAGFIGICEDMARKLNNMILQYSSYGAFSSGEGVKDGVYNTPCDTADQRTDQSVC